MPRASPQQAGYRKPLSFIAWLGQKPYIVSLRKRKEESAFPFSTPVSWAGWFRPTELSARGGKLECRGRRHSFELDIPLSLGYRIKK